METENMQDTGTVHTTGETLQPAPEVRQADEVEVTGRDIHDIILQSAAELEADNAPKPDAADAAQPAQTAQANPPGAPTQPQYEPLEQWTEAEKQAFKNLPTDDARKAWLDTYKGWSRGFTQKFEELADERKRYARLNKVFEPYQDYFNLNGIDPDAYIGRLVELDKLSTQNPQAFLQLYAKNMAQRGVNVLELLQPRERTPLEEAIGPLQQEIGQLKEQLAQRTGADLSAEVSAFAAAKNEDGTAKYPHFDALRPDMARLLQSGQAKGLEDAYQTALWTNPQLREAMLEAERTKIRQNAQQQAAVQKARQAAVSVADTAFSAVKHGPMDPADYIKQALNELGAV